MRRNSKRTLLGTVPFGRIPGFGRRWVPILAIFVVVGCTLGYVARGYTKRLSEPDTKVSMPSAVSQKSSPIASNPFIRLRTQPEADKLRRRLGKRFTKSGLEVSVLLGTLTIDGDRKAIRITRAQDSDGEQIAIAIGSESATLTWTSDQGAKAGTADASKALRSIVERLVLDSPDQFIYAQLRGAAYHKMGENVRPAEAAGSDDYDGPVWDMVRVIESTSRSERKPMSDWRIYYINSSTGLIDKILSQEDGENVIAQLSSWVSQGGEALPARITWTRNKQLMMELNLTNVSLIGR
jgi:hypothetical protein